MKPDECLEFCKILEEELLHVWFDGKYLNGSPRWGAKEVGFMSGDKDLTDPFMLGGSEQYGFTPLEAARACLRKRRRPPRKKGRR